MTLTHPWAPFFGTQCWDSALQLGEDGFRLGELVSHLLLVPELHAVGNHDEVAPAPLDQIDLAVCEGLADGSAQTGRPWFVVSDNAVFDRHVHG